MEDRVACAIQKGYFQQVRFLVEVGRSVDAVDEQKRTPLMLCALIDPEEWGAGLARLLIEKNANLTKRDPQGLTAVHYACIYDRIELLKVLLSAPDFDPNEQDRLGNTALHYCARRGNLKTTRLMLGVLKRYRYPIDVINRIGVTPLIQAWKSLNPECATLIAESGGGESEEWRDYVDQMTVKEWEERAMTIIKDREDMRSTRTKSAQSRNRPASTGRHLVRRRIRSTSSLPEEIPEEESVQIIPVDKYIKGASQADLRNKPEYILQTSALDFFGDNGRSCIVNSSRGLRKLSMDHNGSYSWRLQMKKLYGDFEYQCAGSYRKGAIPPVSHGLFPHRPGSPHMSEYSEAVSDLTVSSKRSRKHSNRSSVDHSKRRQSSASSTSSRQRRTSATLQVPPNLKSQSAQLDSSSNESLNSRTGKKRNSIKEEPVEPTTPKTEKPSSGRTSRAAQHSKDSPDPVSPAPPTRDRLHLHVITE